MISDARLSIADETVFRLRGTVFSTGSVKRRKKMRICRYFSYVAVLAVAFCAVPAYADEVSDQIKEGLQLYEKGSYSEAVQTLNFAVGQIQQKQTAGLKDVFPEPLKGWSAEESTGQFAGAPMLGGGITASRHYSVEDGDKTVDIEIVTDSPLLQSVLMLYTNPAFFANQPDTKLVKIQGRKAVQKFNAKEKEGEISIVIGSRMLVSIKGNQLPSIDDMMAYANAISYETLEKFLEK
jgi:hypothetical protein